MFIKKVISLLVAIILLQQVQAQVLSEDTVAPVLPDKGKPQLFHGMVIGGANFSQVDGDHQAGYNKVGCNCGGGLLVNLPKKFSTSIEMLFSMKGANGSSDNYKVLGYWHDIHLDYVDVALMANYNLVPWLMFSMGLIPNVLVYSSDYFLYGGCPSCPGGVSDNTLGYRPVTMDGSLGLTGFYKKHFGLNFRFQYSMFRINDIPYFPGQLKWTTFNGQYFNNLIALRALYLF